MADRDRNGLESSILAARAGEAKPSDVLAAFSAARVLIPSITATQGDLRDLTPLEFDTPDGPMVAAFSDLDQIGEFQQAAPHALEIAGWQLAELLPSGKGVVINPRRPVGFQFPPHVVDILRSSLARQRAAASGPGAPADS